jgi:hypothetical protein
MPGVFVLTFDNCEYGETYRHRQCLITNQPWLAWLSRDCSGTHVHEQLSGAGRPTATVSPYAKGLVKHWVHLFNVFLKAPMKSRCVFCAHAAGQSRTDIKAIAPREPARLTVGRSLRAVLGVDFDSDASASNVFDDEFVEAGMDEAVLRVVVSSERALGRGYG